MAARSHLWPDPRVRPPYGAAEINWSHPLTVELRALWLFGNSPGLEPDLCGRGQRMTITGGAVTGRGLVNNGSSTDGTFANPVSGPLRFSSGEAKTVWALAQARIADGAYHGVLANDAGPIPLIQNSANKWACAWNGTEYADTATPLVVGEWASLVGTWNGTNLRLYKSGTLYQNTTPTPASSTTGVYHVGNNVGGQYFDGVIEVLAIWGRALGPADALWLAAEPYAILRPIVQRRSVHVAGSTVPRKMHHYERLR